MHNKTSSMFGRRFIGLLVVGALTLGACGSGGSGGGDDSDGAAVTTESASGGTETTAMTENSGTAATDDTMSDDTPDDTMAESALPPGEYLIGFQAITSGPAAFAGVPLSQGAELKVKEVNDNKSLGEGVTINLKVEDAGGDTAAAIGVVEGFLNDGASVVLCCGLSSVAGSVKPILAEKKTAGIVTSAILPDLNEPPYMYRPVLLLSDPAYGELIGMLNKDGSYKTASVIVTADNDGMVNEATVWEKGFADNGIEVLGTVDTATGDTDFSGPATQVIDQNPDIVALAQLGQEATLMAKALRDRGYEGKLITTYGISNSANYEIGGEALAGIIFPVAFTPQMTEPEAVAFTEAYKAEYGEDPDVFAAQGYTAAQMALEGIVKAGSGDPDAVAQALSTITEMNTPYGLIEFENGQARLAGATTFMEWNADGTQSIWTG